jgi:hypothetical protein
MRSSMFTQYAQYKSERDARSYKLNLALAEAVKGAIGRYPNIDDNHVIVSAGLNLAIAALIRLPYRERDSLVQMIVDRLPDAVTEAARSIKDNAS